MSQAGAEGISGSMGRCLQMLVGAGQLATLGRSELAQHMHGMASLGSFVL